MSEHWHILQTKLGRERQLAVQLHQRGLEVYLPLVWVNPVNSRSARERPYFPSYVFAKFDFEVVAPRIIRWSPGLRGLVESCGEPVAVSDSFVAELAQRLSRVRSIEGMAFDARHGPGFFGINEGPFAGFEGIFNARLSGADRARVLLACAHREHARCISHSPPAVTPQSEIGKTTLSSPSLTGD